jgi:uncharacterized protein YjbI with pentapeptide repeats
LLRFFGEEIQFRDSGLRLGLRQLLTQEQIKFSQINYKQQQKNDHLSTEPETLHFKTSPAVHQYNPTAAVVASLLVAAKYSFSGQELSYLDLTGAYLQGYIFEGAKFHKSILRKANIRHARIDRAQFFQTDLRELEVGLRTIIMIIGIRSTVLPSPLTERL